MHIHYHGHACFSLFTDNNQHILIDPYLNDNPLADTTAESLTPDVVLITHGHHDHFGDALLFAQKGALIVSTVEIIDYLEQKGDFRLHKMQIGGRYHFDFGTVKMVPATHSSTIQEGSVPLAAGAPGGFLLDIDGVRIYHAGDTGLTAEMSLLAYDAPIDWAMLPIGGNFTMDIPDALQSLQLLRPRAVIPMHYDTFGLIRQNPAEFAAGAAQFGIHCAVMHPGESIEISKR